MSGLAQLRDDRLGRVDPVADAGAGDSVGRQVQVDPRAKAYEPVALATGKTVAALRVAEDAPRNEAGDLHAGDLGAGGTAVRVHVEHVHEDADLQCLALEPWVARD